MLLDESHSLSRTSSIGVGKQRSKLLRDWYLARLRKAALENRSQNLTPAGLIDADRKLIESLVLAAAKDQVTASGAPPLARYIVTGLIVIAVLLGLCLAFFGAQLRADNSTLFFLVALALVALLFASLVTFEVTIVRPISKLSAKLASLAAVKSDAKTYEFLEEQVDNLVRERDEHASGEALIADVTTEIIACIDMDLRFVAVNHAVHSTLSFLPEELLGKSLMNVILPEDRGKLTSCLQAVKSAGSCEPMELRALNKAGTAIDLRMSIEWSFSEINFFICATNITDQKTLERARREFVATIGHDIRVPLSSVLATIDALEQGVYGELSVPCAEALGRSNNSIQRLIHLINELLDYERMSAGKISLALSTVDLNELVAAAREELQSEIEKERLDVRCNVSELSVRGDAGKLLRVTINLLSNAIKFSERESSIDITVSRRGTLAEVRIKDNGPGIPVEYQRLIFERYERLSSTEESISGAGLGLAICKSIVEAHGGVIGVDSDEGQGSEFWFALPITAADSD